MNTVDIQYATDDPEIPDARTIKTWVRAALHDLQPDAELTIRIVGLDEGIQLNERWRNTPGATNVLSFPAQSPETAAVPCREYIGDVIICAPVVHKESLQQNKDPGHHWAHMVIHGILHLMGYDHIEAEMAEQMESLEVSILAGLGIDNPYIIPE
jgi:probable rRNA maturation factor